MTSPGRGTPKVAATFTCTCRKTARAAGCKLRIAAGVHCLCARPPPQGMARAWTTAWSEIP
eukprot:10143497-Lingulodinium_polyedra.AAC.1